MSETNSKKRRGKWVVIYILSFIAVFIVSVIIKVTYSPLSKLMKVDWSDKVGTIYTDLTYNSNAEGGDEEKHKYDLYVPADKNKASYGLVVYIHAGGFTTGDKSEDATILKWICSQGFVAAGINYTLRDESHENTSVYTQSLEIKDSMKDIKNKSKELGYNLDRVAMSGGTAGGTLSLLYAYRDAEYSASIGLPVKMAFEMVGPPSFFAEDWKSYGLDQSPKAAADLFSVMAGVTITEEDIKENKYADKVKNISPYAWVNSSSCPTPCAYGVKDKVCPFNSVKHLVNALKDNNVTYEYIECSHSGHALQNDDKLFKKYIETMKEYLNKYMK